MPWVARGGASGDGASPDLAPARGVSAGGTPRVGSSRDAARGRGAPPGRAVCPAASSADDHQTARRSAYAGRRTRPGAWWRDNATPSRASACGRRVVAGSHRRHGGSAGGRPPDAGPGGSIEPVLVSGSVGQRGDRRSLTPNSASRARSTPDASDLDRSETALRASGSGSRGRAAGSHLTRDVQAAASADPPPPETTGSTWRQYQRRWATPCTRSDVRHTSSSTSSPKTTAPAEAATGPAAGRTATRLASAMAVRAHCPVVPSMAASSIRRTTRMVRPGRPGGCKSSERSRDSLRTRKPASWAAPRWIVRTVSLPTRTGIVQIPMKGGRLPGSQIWLFTKTRYGFTAGPTPARPS